MLAYLLRQRLKMESAHFKLNIVLNNGKQNEN